jgi:histidine triad (HIT) family protein
MDNCPFCKVIAGSISGFIIDEDESTIVLLSLENHPLVLPRVHIPDLWALDDQTAASVISKSIRIARAMQNGLPCDGIYVTQTNGACAGQSVFHYHMHLYPRWNDGESKHLGGSKEELAGRIRAALHQHLDGRELRTMLNRLSLERSGDVGD